MEKIILADGTEYEIHPGAALDNIQINAPGFDEVERITEAFTKENLTDVSFVSGDNVTGKYHNLVSEKFSHAPGTALELEDGSEAMVYVVKVSLREETDVEKRLDALEAGQETLQQGHESNAGAIEELADMVAGSEV